MMRLLRTKESLIFEKLFPAEYKSFGCGPGGVGDWLVPDTMWGLSVKPACQQHDHDYRFGSGSSEEHRKQCDIRMRLNMLIIVDAESKTKTFKALRHIRVNTYYLMVRWHGGRAYWSERN